ncbi:MAG TPA: hypothetical protein VMZ27_11935 [Candidatus Saccharimonadales bacterium]|nr:hypothetical protein [Candidatus Saccharimonadales bacterium]
MKTIIAVCAIVAAFIALPVKADNSVLGKGKARNLQKQVEGQGSAGVTTPKTNAPTPKVNGAGIKKP